MSLVRRVWLIIVVLLVLAFGSSLAISYTTLRNHIEDTLRLQNIDNANTLALAMTQMRKQPVALELLIATQFDSGHYQLISLDSADGHVSIARASRAPINGAPAWFVWLVDLQVPAATAAVHDGPREFATLKLASRYQHAYRALWHGTRNLVASFSVAVLLSLLLAYAAVRGIRRPLAGVVEQARQIGDRRFRIMPEPRIRELQAVVKSMNQLSRSVHGMLLAESAKLQRLQERMRTDKVTGLLNREHFFDHVDGLLHRESALGSGMLAMLRVPALAKLNDSLGYAATNALLMALGLRLKHIEQSRPNTVAGRLNGSDFALAVAGDQDSDALARELSQALAQLAAERTDIPILSAALTTYGPSHSRSFLLAALDSGLARAENRADGRVEVIHAAGARRLFDSREQMHAALLQALETGGLRFQPYPVVTADNVLLYEDCPTRLYLADQWHPAATFLPWIGRYHLTAAFDLRVLDAALHELRQRRAPMAINLSVQTLTDGAFIEALIRRLTTHDAAGRVLLEWPAAGALAQREAFDALIDRLVAHGYTIGLKHAGQESAQIAQLHGLDLARITLEASLIRDIHLQPHRQGYIRSQCILLHSLGIQVVAAGVHTKDESDTLTELGIDALTGPGISLQ